MLGMRRQLGIHLLALALLALSGCASKVLVPPRVDLSRYGAIGIIDFTSDAGSDRAEFATQQFQQTIQAAQSGAAILELGSSGRVLRSVGHEELDFRAVRAIGEKYGVDAVISGELLVTELKPKLNLSRNITSIGMQKDVEASISARIMETRSGATRWTDSASHRATVAKLSILNRGPATLSAGDPEDAYGRLIHSLVMAITGDFRSHYE
jgi:hypothetical protein